MSKKPLIIVLAVLALVVLAVLAYMRFFSPRTISSDLEESITGPTPTEIVDISEEVEVVPKAKGSVEGKICFPSSFVPEGYIMVKNVETDVVEKTYFEGVPPKSQEYSLSLDEGKYVFAFAKMDEVPMGFYTPCAPTASVDDCSTPESHKLVEVEVRAGETVSNIDLCDYYYQAQEKPEF